MDPGELNQRLTFERQTPTREASGATLPVWQVVGTVFAKVQPLSSRELIAAQAAAASTTHRITIRWRPDLAPPAPLRARWQARVFDLGPGLNLEEANVWLRFEATEGVQRG